MKCRIRIETTVYVDGELVLGRFRVLDWVSLIVLKERRVVGVGELKLFVALRAIIAIVILPSARRRNNIVTVTNFSVRI